MTATRLSNFIWLWGAFPHYLEEIKDSGSAVQNIEKICFSKKGLLFDEFSKLYPALFANADRHIAIIRTLATKQMGMTRKQITENTLISEGGTAQKVLEELVQSGFVSAYRPFGKKKKEKLYRLTDEYSLFYLRFIENKEHEGGDIWQHLSQTPAYRAWSGYAFENICLKHISQIKKALGISGIYSLSSSFYKKGTDVEPGIQIDLLIDRKDHVVNLFEIKFHNDAFSISKSYAEKLRAKMGVFRKATKTKKQLSWVLLTTFGLGANKHSLGLVHQDLDMNDLFEA